jgi:uncharacterized protein
MRHHALCCAAFHTARQLIEIIKREIGDIGETFDGQRADVAVLAALLHDLGHGPLSHAFEEVQKARSKKKKHEKWSAEIIRSEKGAIRALPDNYRPGLAAEIAELLETEDPKDIYHAVVSSSFDADRLDYLQRDRLMTGTQAGAIDFDWLMEHVRVRRVSIEAPDEDDPKAPPMQVPTFCLDSKALPAAEQFLLARYTLHEQVYFHKVKRCVEHMVSELLGQVACYAGKEEAADQTGLRSDHPMLTLFLNDDLDSYLQLDDTVLWGGIQAMSRAQDTVIQTLARRLRDRRLYKTLDITRWGPDAGKQAQRVRTIDKRFQSEIASRAVLKDEATKLNIYTQVGGGEERMHKKLHVLDAGRPIEISSQSELVPGLNLKSSMVG